MVSCDPQAVSGIVRIWKPIAAKPITQSAALTIAMGKSGRPALPPMIATAIPSARAGPAQR
jgi:hypothetical protein